MIDLCSDTFIMQFELKYSTATGRANILCHAFQGGRDKTSLDAAVAGVVDRHRSQEEDIIQPVVLCL